MRRPGRPAFRQVLKRAASAVKGLETSADDRVFLVLIARRQLSGNLQPTYALLPKAHDETARKEMDLFGIKAAVPIFGQGKLAGGILLDCHLTGESLTNGELTELFFFLEKLGESVCAARANSEAICAFIEGLVHHLGNAAVPIATRMQLAAEGKCIELDQEAKDGIAKIGQITAQLRRTAQEHREEKTNVIESILRATQPSTHDH